MSFVAKLYENDRSVERYPVMLDGTLRNTKAEPQDVVIEDLSATGFRIIRASATAVGEIITIGIFGIGLRTAMVLRESEAGYGCRFAEPLDRQELSVALSGLVAPAPIRLHGDASGPPVVRSAPNEEPGCSPRLRAITIAAAGIVPWAILILLRSLISG